MKSISVNMKINETIIKIEENAEIENIIKDLKSKLVGLKKLYKEEKTPIRVTGKVIKNKEMDEIQALIQEYLQVNVEFDTPKTLGLSSIVRTFNKEIEMSETKFHKGSLRSGQKMEIEGSIVVLGDVNSGAELMATDNIVVLGNLRGLAHAGAKGNKQAIIACGTLDAPQLRIANIVKELNRDEEIYRKQVYIYINEEDKITIE